MNPQNPHDTNQGERSYTQEHQPSADSQVSFRRLGLYPWTGVYVTVDDQIRLRVWCPAGNVTVNVSLRWQGPDGRIIPEFFQVAGAANGSTPTTQLLNPAEGFLLSANAETPGVAQGACYVVLDIIRGRGTGDATQGHILISGYPGSVGSEGFPQSPIGSPIDGRGRMLSVAGGAPAAGAEFFITVPAGREWIFRSLNVQFVASATVANRGVTLEVLDGGGNLLVAAGLNVNIVASNNFRIEWAPGCSTTGNLTNITAGFPMECRMLPGWVIRSLTVNIQAGDQYGTQGLLVEEFVDS